MTNKNYLEAFTSPVGEAVFPWLTTADTEHVASGVYHTDLSSPADEAQGFITILERALDEFVATLPVAKQKALKKKGVYTYEMTRPPADASDEVKHAFVPEPTGNVLFRFKLKAMVTPKPPAEPWEQAPIVVDAATGERIKDPVYGGSIIQCRGQIVPYTNEMSATVGVTLRLRAVQVFELVTGSGGSGFWTNFDGEAAA
jgi:hypothetical protein